MRCSSYLWSVGDDIYSLSIVFPTYAAKYVERKQKWGGTYYWTYGTTVLYYRGVLFPMTSLKHLMHETRRSAA